MASGTLKKDVILNLEIDDQQAVSSLAALTKHLDELKIQRKNLSEATKNQIADEEKAMGKAYTAQQRNERYTQIYYESLAKLDVEIKETQRSISAYQKELQNNLVSEKTEADSLDAMRAKLLNMRKEYESLSKAQRDNPLVGGKQLKDIQDLTAEIKQLEQAQGDWRRNVGNYPSAFDATTESITTFGQALASVFGGNGIIGKAATVVVGFGRGLQQMGKDVQDTATQVTDSLNGMAQGAQVVENAGQAAQNVTAGFQQTGEAAQAASTTVQGFGKALYDTSDAEQKAASGAAATAKGAEGMSGAFKGAGAAVKGFSKQMLALLANPIVAAISAIVVVLVKLAAEFKKNDAAMTALQQVFAAFRPILDVINRAFQALVGVLGKVAEGFAAVVSWLVKLIPGMREYAEAEMDTVLATDALEEAERQYTVNHAKREKEISELRAKAAEADKYSFSERKKFMEQAAELEKQDLKENRDNAKERLRIKRQELANNMGFAQFNSEVYEKMSDDMKNELAQLEAAVYGAEKAYSDGMRTINKSMATFTRQEQAEQKARAQAAAQAAKERLKNEREALAALSKMWIDGISNLRDREYAATKQAGEKEIQALKNRLKEEKNLSKAAREAVNRQIILSEADLQIKLGELRKKWETDEQARQLQRTKEYYQHLLNGLSTTEAKVQVQLEINELDSKSIKNSLEATLKDIQKTAEDAENDFMSLDYNELADKYAAVWEARNITTGDNIAKMRELVRQYNEEAEKAAIEHQNAITAIDMETEKKRKEILAKGTKDIHDEELKRIDLSRKHAEILRQIELSGSYDEYGRNELEKTRIMQEQAEERLKIAQEEYARMAAEREKYTDDELVAIYGSLEAYNNALAESQLKVIQGENDVKDAIKDVSIAAANQKSRMIETANTIMESLNGILGSFQSLFETMAESDEKYADYATAMAMMQILVSTAISIANAIQGATAAGAATGIAAPFTTPAFITEMVAIVAGAVANAVGILNQARQQKASKPKFSEGGLVGKRTTRKKDDKIDAKLTEGEYVISAPVVDKLGVKFFDWINGKKKSDPRSAVTVSNVTDNSVKNIDARVSEGEYVIQAPAVETVGVKFLDWINFQGHRPISGYRRSFASGGQVTASAGAIPRDAIRQTETIGYEDMRAAMAEAVSEVTVVADVREITRVQNRIQAKQAVSQNR